MDYIYAYIYSIHVQGSNESRNETSITFGVVDFEVLEGLMITCKPVTEGRTSETKIVCTPLQQWVDGEIKLLALKKHVYPINMQGLKTKGVEG